MVYENIRPAVFLSRPNRFIAQIEIEGKQQICHVKNTGRCRELLVPNAPIFVQKSDKPERKTKYDLISVQKGTRLVNIDSSAPSRVFQEWILTKSPFPGLTKIQPEQKHGDSRFDFYLEFGGKAAFAEMKGVTLEQGGVVRFPDAPTERGVKHLNGLIQCLKEGYGAYAVFVIQMQGVRYLEPNWDTHWEFGDAMRKAAAAGVQILALDCRVTENSIVANDFVEVRL